MISEYLASLHLQYKDVADRYKNKIRLINNVDPFTISEVEFDYTPESFPSISAADIICYLVFTHSYYTQSQMKAYKSLEAYKYFEAGFVQKCAVTEINSYKVVFVKVKHSQRMNLLPLQLWVICEGNGTILSAHCTCMAGTSEVCSHIAATLYALEHIHLERSATSCTDQLAVWKIPALKDSPMCSLKEMLKNKLKPTSSPTIAPIVGDELMSMMNDIEAACGSCAIMAGIEPFASKLAEKENEALVQPTYDNLFQSDYELFTQEELFNLASNFNAEISPKDCEILFNATKRQSECKTWYLHRKGRITASIFRSVCFTKIDKPSLTVIKSICYPLKCSINTPAISWGRSHEKNGIRKYILQQDQHENFQFFESGLIIDPCLPEFAATPDGLCECKCCGTGCVEIKCPYLMRNLSLKEYATLNQSCLENTETAIQLKRNHSYFYQVQLQMKLSGRNYCDFFVWSPNEYFCERIYFCEEFWTNCYTIAKDFHNNVILPELFGKFYTRNYGAIELWCICKAQDDGRPMLECGNPNCDIKWFHFCCVGLESVPEDAWRCDKCT